MRRLLAAVAAAAVVGLPTLATAAPTPSPTVAGPEAPLQLTVTQLLPRAPTRHSAVQVLGVIRNIGATPVSRITVRLRVGEVVKYRDQLHAADTDRPPTVPVPPTRTTPVITDLAAGASLKFDLRTTTDQLDLRSLGVYPLDIEAQGDAGDGRVVPLGLAPTWLPYFPDGPNPIRVAVVLPVIDEPHQGVDSTLHDDDLAARLGPGGRLYSLVHAGLAAANGECDKGAVGPGVHITPDPRLTRCEAVPVTFAVDPDLLVAATTMSKPYKVKQANGQQTPGKGTDSAVSWLASMRVAAQTDQVLALPYADPDITALTRTSGGPDDVALASVLGSATVTDLLKTNPLESVAWPPAGPVSQAGADALARNGARALVLDESAYGQPDTEPDATPDARTVFATSATGSELDGLVADGYLSDLVTGPTVADLGPRLAEQRFLAETAIIAAQRPGLFRTLLIAPDRRSPVSLSTLTASLRDLGRVPWLCPVSLTSAATGTEECSGHPTDKPLLPVDRGEPRTDTSGQLSAGLLAGIAADRRAIDQLTTAVLSDKQDPPIRDAVASMKQRLRRAVARAESSAWRTDPAGGRTQAGELHREVDRLRDKIVIRGGKALLTSSKGTLQVSLENTLDVPIDVHVRISSDTGALSAAQSGLVEVTPGHAVQAGVNAEARKSGQFKVYAQIIDRDGKPFGKRAEIIVRSTRFGRLALAVTAGALGVLFVAAGVRIVRRAVRSRP